MSNLRERFLLAEKKSKRIRDCIYRTRVSHRREPCKTCGGRASYLVFKCSKKQKDVTIQQDCLECKERATK